MGANVYRSVNQILESIEDLLRAISQQLGIITSFLPPKGTITMGIDAMLNKFVWDWVQGAGGAITGFRIYFGTAPGARNNAYDLPDPAARSVRISDVVTGTPSVTIYAVVVAVNSAGISPESNEVSFTFVVPPVLPEAPTNFRIELI